MIGFNPQRRSQIILLNPNTDFCQSVFVRGARRKTTDRWFGQGRWKEFEKEGGGDGDVGGEKVTSMIVSINVSDSNQVIKAKMECRKKKKRDDHNNPISFTFMTITATTKTIATKPITTAKTTIIIIIIIIVFVLLTVLDLRLFYVCILILAPTIGQLPSPHFISVRSSLRFEVKKELKSSCPVASFALMSLLCCHLYSLHLPTVA